jgi:hypothetical protein
VKKGVVVGEIVCNKSDHEIMENGIICSNIVEKKPPLQ